ncbi:probable caffeoyl-CoA O-methyltransferase At4g26220 [Solanum stenotomum]|uniref:probable caffeoyl-CoA O-methyltransferase At4g26220 n=1 Tax=Solanum stenotomum TaxID=172797 RepID=UPI0020D018A2|nr:probable caffeoyl-CoA O-methyltransferase At4g26220 [Solanum stenotomum]
MNLHSNASDQVEGSPWDNKGLLQSQELYRYVLETSVYPREPEPLKEIRAITANLPDFYMGTTPDSGQLIAMLLNLLNAKNTIELGVFTGYSLLLTALTIPDDGKILAIDSNLKSYELGLPVIRKASVEHKINFKHSPALPVLDKLLEDDKNRGSFDFAFVDADKTNYGNYHERLMKLMKIGGLIVYDNTLWYGTLAMPEESVHKLMRSERSYLLEFNKFLAADTRIQISQVSLGDGMTICRRLF